MKKLFVITLLLIAFALPVFGQEEAVVETTSGIQAWMPVIGDILVFIIEIISPILVIFAIFLARKLSKKLGIEETAVIDGLVRKIVREAVNHADAWAKAQRAKPVPEDKMIEAVRYGMDVLKAAGVKDLAKERLQALIEAQLSYDRKANIHVSL